MTVQHFINVSKRKNIDSAFAALATVLEETSSGTAPATVTLAANEIYLLNPFTTEIVNIVDTGNGPIQVGLPVGVNGQRVKVRWAIESGNNNTITLGTNGYNLMEYTKAYSILDQNVSFSQVGAFVEIEWSDSYGSWFLVSHAHMRNVAEHIVGKTSYSFEMSHDAGPTSVYINPTNHYDVYAHAVIDSVATGVYTLQANFGNYSGQRCYIRASMNTPATLDVTGQFLNGSTPVSLIAITNGGFVCLEWREATDKWFIIEKSASAVLT